MDGSIVAFLLASVLVILVPGVDFALVTRQTITFGRSAAIATAAGLLTSGLTHACMAAFGLSALLLASAEAYTALKLAGAAYLVWLGVQMLRGSRADTSAADPAARRDAPTMSYRRAYLLGLTSNLLNVKMAAFFVTFLPQFVAPGGGAATRTLLLGLLFNAIATSWWLIYIALLGRLYRWLRLARVRLAIDRVTGAVLIALGVGVASSGEGRGP